MSRNLDDQIVDILNESKRLEIENESLKKRIQEATNLIKEFSLHRYVMDAELSIKSHDEIYEFLHDKLTNTLVGELFEDAEDVLKKMEDMG